MNNKQRKEPSRNQFNFPIWYILIAAFILMSLSSYLFNPVIGNISYSEFKRLVKDGRVESCQLTSSLIKGTLREEDLGQAKQNTFVTARVDDPELVKELEAHGIKYSGNYENTWLQQFLFTWIIPIGIFFLIWRFVFKKMGPTGSIMSFGKSKGRIYAQEDLKFSFDDVAGIDEAKEELQEVVEFLKTPHKFTKLGGRIPKGVLLAGAPGTGKTLLAKAVAGEAGGPFFSLSGSGLRGRVVGGGGARGGAPPPRRHDPARDPRPGPAAPGAVRPAGRDRPAGPQRAREDPPRPHPPGDARARPRPRADRGADARVRGGRPRESRERAPPPRRARRQGRGGRCGLRRGDRPHRRRARAEVARHQPEREGDRGLPRGRARARGRVAPARRPRGQDLDHPPRGRGARLHAAAADRGPLPHDARRAARPARRAPGRARGRGAGLRGRLHGRPGRPAAGDGHRAPHDHPLQHERDARPGDLRGATAGALLEGPRVAARPGVQRADSRGDRRRDPEPAPGRAPPRPRHAHREARAAPAR